MLSKTLRLRPRPRTLLFVLEALRKRGQKSSKTQQWQQRLTADSPGRPGMPGSPSTPGLPGCPGGPLGLTRPEVLLGHGLVASSTWVARFYRSQSCTPPQCHTIPLRRSCSRRLVVWRRCSSPSIAACLCYCTFLRTRSTLASAGCSSAWSCCAHLLLMTSVAWRRPALEWRWW